MWSVVSPDIQVTTVEAKYQGAHRKIRRVPQGDFRNGRGKLGLANPESVCGFRVWAQIHERFPFQHTTYILPVVTSKIRKSNVINKPSLHTPRVNTPVRGANDHPIDRLWLTLEAVIVVGIGLERLPSFLGTVGEVPGHDFILGFRVSCDYPRKVGESPLVVFSENDHVR